MTTLRTASKVAAAATVIGAAALWTAPATAASNDWHRVSKTFVNFCSDHHDRTGASFIVSNSSGKTVGAYSANHGTKGVVVRVELFNKYGHVTAVGPWR